MWAFLHRLASPPHFYHLSGRLLPWLGLAASVCMALGLYLGLWVAPPDYQQGDSFRIMYVHVPAAWMSLFVYVFMAVSGGIGLIWNLKMADILAVCSAPLGASFTFLALVTGAIWGKPMWGTWWVWDARLTSELILLFLYLGYLTLQNAIEDPRTAARAAAILAIIGSVNIPIIHYSVEWWNTLHQGPTVTRLAKPAIHPSMLWPLLLMAVAFQLYFFAVLLLKARTELLWRERRSRWVRELLADAQIKPMSKVEETL
jgi:heme exporter protein C